MIESKLRVLMVDPWCDKNHFDYTKNLCYGLSEYAEVELCSSDCPNNQNDSFAIKRFFFKKSKDMKRGFIRKIVRGIEYVFSYRKVFIECKNNRFDIVHFQWFLMPLIDAHYLKKIRKKTKKIIFTSHNAIPHSCFDLQKYIRQFRKIHSLCDRIIVHGDSICSEYLSFFPEDRKKIYIQKHGVYIDGKTDFNLNNVESTILSKINSINGKIVLDIGTIFYNKGTDRPIEFWQKNRDIVKNDFLVIAGEVIASSKLDEGQKLSQVLSLAKKEKNIFIIDRFLNNDEFSFLLSSSDIVLIPYRHASMSGIFFSAVAYKKPVIFTDVGSLKEYSFSIGAYCVENNDDILFSTIESVMKKEKCELAKEGDMLHNFIYQNYNWRVISKELIENLYKLHG